jgi:cytochrome c
VLFSAPALPLSLNIAAGAIFASHNPEKPVYEIAAQEQDSHGKPGEPAAAEEPLPVRFASADVGRGENSAKKCAACHTFGKGEPNRVGPNLWGVVGRQKASEAGFNYSAAMKAQKGNWTPEDLDAYLTNPKAMVPGTNMTAGIPRGKNAPTSSLISTASRTSRPNCPSRPQRPPLRSRPPAATPSRHRPPQRPSRTESHTELHCRDITQRFSGCRCGPLPEN